MENCLKPFLERGVIYSSEKIPINEDGSIESNAFIRFLQKLIFKHDVVNELKQILNSACFAKPFTVKNEVIQKLIKHLNTLLLSKEDSKIKSDIFSYLFQSFTASCKDDNVPVMQFFIVLCHILGMSEIVTVNSNDNSEDSKHVLIDNNFNSVFNVNITSPSPISFSILKELLLHLSKLSINFNATEVLPYCQWLHQLIKHLAYYQPFQNVFLEIFSIIADLDLKLLEGNSEHMLHCVLVQKLPVDEKFCLLYELFLGKALQICSKFQRSVKFVNRYLSSIKATPTCLPKDIVLPKNVLSEFSNIVAVGSNQQSLLLMDTFLQNLKDCLDSISEDNSDANFLLLEVTNELFISFFKNVKLFAPSISFTTLQTFISKLNILKEMLQNFGSYLFSNKDFAVKNENIVVIFLELCFYCGEIQVLINCYKDSVLHPGEITESHDLDWQCCLSNKQWTNLVKNVLKHKSKDVGAICFKLALQKIRICKLENEKVLQDDSIQKIIFSQPGLNIFQQMSPDDFIILMNVLTTEQSREIMNKLCKEAFENLEDTNLAVWLCNSVIQENYTFIVSLFSELLKKAGSVLCDVLPEKNHSKVTWLLDEYFDENYCIHMNNLEQLPEKINALLKKRKKFANNKQNEIIKIIKIFKLLPLPFMKIEIRSLGLSFAVGMGALLSDDENCMQLVLESVYGFLTSEMDASVCFDIGACIKWLSGLYYDKKEVEQLRIKVIESLVRNSIKTKFGLNQIGEMVDSTEVSKNESSLRVLENRLLLYNELGKCFQRAKKRKSENDLIGNCRVKLAKVISDEAKELKDSNINPENFRILLKIFGVDLNKAIKANEESEIAMLMEQKFPSYFEFAIKSIKKDNDEVSASFLIAILKSVSQIRKFLPEDAFLKIWKVLRYSEKGNWQLFCLHSSDEEFKEVLTDLLKMSKKFLNSESEKHSTNCFEIWSSFIKSSSKSKKNECQYRLQELFHYIHDCGLVLGGLSTRKKCFMIKFFGFCVSERQVIITSQMLDTIIYVMLECLDDSSSVEDFENFFRLEVETASAILLRQFAWSTSKVHLTYVLFKRLLDSLMKKYNAGHQISNDEVIKLATCAFCMEKWAALMIREKKDFARITAYFITILISSVASVTVFPAIKIHLVNCINHFLSISDSHTVSYLMRVLKPGYQQVFNTTYNQFKKYHKYSGKI